MKNLLLLIFLFIIYFFLSFVLNCNDNLSISNRATTTSDLTNSTNTFKYSSTTISYYPIMVIDGLNEYYTNIINGTKSVYIYAQDDVNITNFTIKIDATTFTPEDVVLPAKYISCTSVLDFFQFNSNSLHSVQISIKDAQNRSITKNFSIQYQ